MARDEEAARYERAAQLALDEIDWCVKYLHSIRKYRLAKALDKNRAAINRRLREAADAGVRTRT
jgi:hypothetical protein